MYLNSDIFHTFKQLGTPGLQVDSL